MFYFIFFMKIIIEISKVIIEKALSGGKANLKQYSLEILC